MTQQQDNEQQEQWVDAREDHILRYRGPYPASDRDAMIISIYVYLHFLGFYVKSPQLTTTNQKFFKKVNSINLYLKSMILWWLNCSLWN